MADSTRYGLNISLKEYSNKINLIGHYTNLAERLINLHDSGLDWTTILDLWDGVYTE